MEVNNLSIKFADGEIVELSILEAKELYKVLHAIFGVEIPEIPSIPMPYITPYVVPYYPPAESTPWNPTWPYTVTCEGNTMTVANIDNHSGTPDNEVIY